MHDTAESDRQPMPFSAIPQRQTISTVHAQDAHDSRGGYQAVGAFVSGFGPTCIWATSLVSGRQLSALWAGQSRRHGDPQTARECLERSNPIGYDRAFMERMAAC